MTPAARPSVGRLALPHVLALLRDAATLRLGVRQAAGATLVDGGIEATGSLEAGRRIAEVCMGGLGYVAIEAGGFVEGTPFRVSVRSAEPVLACLASQYAGWQLSHGDGDGGGEGAYLAMASGPGRARRSWEPNGGEALFAELGYRDDAERICLVLETDRAPPEALILQIAAECGLPPSALTIILTPTTSLAGTVQIAARVLEVALHKLHALGFPLDRVRDGLGTAPLPPPAPDFLTAMGRTNDAILFGGEVQLLVDGPEGEARELAAKLPSTTSRDYGRPFKEVFEAAGFDFYAIDSMLFSPARVAVTALETGRSFTAGRLALELLARSFAVEAA